MNLKIDRNLDEKLSLEESHVVACLYGAAIGDALGMPTQDLTRHTIYQHYGKITDFVAAKPVQTIAKNMPAGKITDDTEQLLIVAKLLIEDQRIDAWKFAVALQQWQEKMIACGSQDLLGPSSNLALENLRKGLPLAEVGRKGYTNGAAMRIAPVGIVYQTKKALIEGIYEATVLTHNTIPALTAAALVAGSINAGLAGATPREAVAYGKEIAWELTHTYVGGIPETSRKNTDQKGENQVLIRLERAEQLLASSRDIEKTLAEAIGTSLACEESVVGALALVETVTDPWEMLLIAARAGGDTDTVGAIAGAVAGAICGKSAFPEQAINTIEQVNHLKIETVAQQLLQVRATLEAKQG